MTKKNKHLLKLLSLSLLPIAAISIPAVVLTSCSSGKEESSDNSNNNQPNNPDDNGGEDNTNPGGEGNNGEDNNNPDVTNPTYPTFASADEVRKACDEAKIDSKYVDEPTFITTHSNLTPADENYASMNIYYPQDENAGDMNYMYISISSSTNNSISTNFADYPIYATNSQGVKYYINPNKAVLLDKIPDLFMLSDEQLKNDSPEVQEAYKKYRNTYLWYKVDVSDAKEELKNLENSDYWNDKFYFNIDYNQSLPNIENQKVYSTRFNSSNDVFSSTSLWSLRLKNDMRFGLTSIFGLSDFVYMGDTHPVSTTYNPADYRKNAIDPNSFGGVVAMKYLKQHQNAVRFIDSITFNAGVSEGCSISSKEMWSNGAEFAYIMNSSQPVVETKPLLPINEAYKQIKNGGEFPTLNVDAKKMYDNVDLSTLQLKKLENGLNWYVTSDSVKLIDLLVTVNGGKTFGLLQWSLDFSDINVGTDTTRYGFDTSRSIFFNDMGTYYYPIYGFSTSGNSHDGLFNNYINNYSYSTFTINFNQPNSK